MQIKIRAEADGGATTWIVDPSAQDGGGETVHDSTRNLEPGQEITITAVDAHEASALEIGDVVTPDVEQPVEGGEQADVAAASDTPAGDSTAQRDEAEAPESEVEEAAEIPAGLAIGRAVTYRSKTGKYDLPAVVTATVATLDPEGVSLGHVPELTSPSRVHLTVFTCGKAGTSRGDNPVNNEAAGGSYQEFNIPQFVVEEIGADQEAAEIVAGTWRWPERV